MSIDVHAHLVPEPLADRLRERTVRPTISAAADGGETIAIHRTQMPFPASYRDHRLRLAAMDRLGLTLQVLSLPGLFGVDSLPAPEAAELTRTFNDAVAGLVADHPRRFRGLAALPLADISLSVEEYRRARGMGLSGMILPGDGFLTLERAWRWLPLLDAARRFGGLVFVHPGPSPGFSSQSAIASQTQHTDSIVARRVSVDIQNQLSEVMVTLCLTELLDPYPEVPVQVANLGGGFLFMIERMEQVRALRSPDQPPVLEQVRPVYLDCASMGPRAIALSAALLGSERILLGTDDPVFDAAAALKAVAGAGLKARDQDRILGDNARELFERID